MDKARLAAFKAFTRIRNGAYSNLISIGDGLQGLDRAFAESIAIGTLERAKTLEFVLNDLVKNDTNDDIFALLMTGLYQILYMDRVPDSAACDETVSIAKTLFGAKNGGFVNAVLRNSCRNKDDIYKKISASPAFIKYSADEELYKLLESQYGAKTEAIFEAFFGKAPTFLRVNSLKSDAKRVKALVNGEILDEKCVKCDNTALAITHIDQGDFYIQGLASQKAVALLDAQRGELVVDVCACPGGKTLGAAIDMQNDGVIYSFDIHKNKLPLIQKSAERLGIDIIKTEVHDARSAREDLIGKADRVICDVPCSGTGVMGSKPEIKYKSPKEFARLYDTQSAIIESASKYLKVGGVMIYSTCSINKLENEENLEKFLKNNKNFSKIYEETCLPFNQEHEGFYMAKLVREF